MKKLTLTLGFFLGIVGAMSVTAAAQVRSGNSRDEVCVFENNYYGGWQQCFRPGEEIRDLGDRRNKISSIRVYGNARATIFTDKDFGGDALEVTSDLNDLAQVKWRAGIVNASWNDRIESLRVTSPFANSRVDRRDDPRYDRDNRDNRDNRDYRDDRRGPPSGRNVVCVYEESDYRGRSECFDSNDEVADLGRIGSWNDRISSIRVYGAARVTVYRDIDFRGDRMTIDRDIPDLRRVRMTGSLNWDNQISSLDINGGRGRAYGRDNRRFR